MQTPESLVAQNVVELRDQRSQTVRSLSARLAELGRPILPSGITKIENCERRVDVGDLVALALAFRVNPTRLLLSTRDRGEKVALTPAIEVRQVQAWDWMRGLWPLLKAYPPEMTGREARDDFFRHALPVGERLRDDHTAVRAAQDVLDSVRAVLDRREHPDEYVDLPPEVHQAMSGGRPSTSTAAGLRHALNRLVAEVEALIGDDDGR